MKLNIYNPHTGKTIVTFSDVKEVDISKLCVHIVFNKSKSAEASYYDLWNKKDEYPDLANNASLYAYGKSVGFTDMADYSFRMG